MDRKEIISLFNSIEKRFPVQEWKIDDMEIWPLIRIRIAFRWYELDLSRPKTESKLTFFTKLRIILIGLAEIIRSVRLVFSGGIEYIFSGNNSHRININGSLYNRYYGPMIDLYSIEPNSFCQFEQDVSISKKKLKPSGNILLLGFIYACFSFIYDKLIGKKSPKSAYLPQSDQVFESLNNFAFNSKKISLELISNEIYVIKKYSLMYRILLKIIKPKAIFTLCYYSSSHLALNHVARSLGIPTIDVQHGVQGHYHIAYGKWQRHSLNGYSFLPRIFWNWDEKSASTISNWSTLTKSKSFVGKNPWMSAWKNKAWLDKYYSNLQSISFSKPLILFSLQPIQNPIPAFIIDLVKSCSSNYQWVFKIHPRQLDEIETINQILLDNGILNLVFDLKQSLEYPLPFLLRNSLLHITQWSSVVIEATEYNVPSLITHTHGVSLFFDSYPEHYYLGKNINTIEDCKKLLEELNKNRLLSRAEEGDNQENIWHKFLKQLENV